MDNIQQFEEVLEEINLIYKLAEQPLFNFLRIYKNEEFADYVFQKGRIHIFNNYITLNIKFYIEEYNQYSQDLITYCDSQIFIWNVEKTFAGDGFIFKIQICIDNIDSTLKSFKVLLNNFILR